MKKKIVIALWISLVVLIIAFCSLVVYQNKQEAARIAQREKQQEAELQLQIQAEEAAKARQEKQFKESDEKLDKDEYTFTDFEETYYAVDKATVREEPFSTAEIIGSLTIDQPTEIVAKCDQSDFYKIKINGDYGFVAFEDLSEEYIDIPLPKNSKPIPTATKDILFIGNSITMYPATKDWWGSGWGCGATTPDKDYVHRTVSAKGYSSFDFMSMRSWEFSNTRNREVDDLDPYITKYQYDKIVIELGENVKGHESHFKEDFRDMVTYIHSYNPNAKVYILDNFWDYSNIINTKKAVASETGCTFVSLADVQGVSKYQLHEGDQFTAPNGTVYTIGSFLAGHPNDEGFEAIAEHLIAAL